jgi:hypothetical protein
LGQSEKLAVAEHRSETRHNINFNNTSILDTGILATGYMDCMIKETIKIRLHPNFNRDPAFTLSQSWHLVTNVIKKYADTPTQMQAKAKQALDSAH